MPELPEVETVRQGLDRWVVGRSVREVQVTGARSVRRHLAGAQDLAARLTGRRVLAARRRGKYLWLPLADDGDARPSDGAGWSCLVAHLGMSGQLLVRPPDAPREKHLHVRFGFTDGGPELRFVDQRTFGGVLVDELVPAADVPGGTVHGGTVPGDTVHGDTVHGGTVRGGTVSGDTVPGTIAHIARDPLDVCFDDDRFVESVRRRHSAVKRILLDQTVVSGIGNIYADESLWRARLHGERPGSSLTRPAVRRLLGEVREVLRAALRAGGTSFDALYVDVNGESGYFDRSLAAYGREGEPCSRCGSPIRRVAFTNRSSFFCPRCQPPPRRRVA